MSMRLNWKVFRLYVSYWKRWPWLTLGSFLFSLVLAMQATIVPLMVALVLGRFISHHVIDSGLIIWTGVLQVGLVIAGYYTDDRAVTTLHLSVEKALYDDSFKYLIHQDYAFFANRFSGSLVTQAARFTKAYSNFSDTLFFNLFPQLFGVMIALVVMVHYSLWIGLTATVLWAVATWIIVVFALRRLPLRRTAVAKESEQIGELADDITNAMTVKSFAGEVREAERYHGLNALRARFFFQSWHRAVRNGWLIQALCAVLQMIVFVGGIEAVAHHSLGIATFLLFQVYIFRIIDSISRTGFTVRQLEVVAGEGEEMTEQMEQSPLVVDRPGAKKARIKKAAIELRDVTFRYEDSTASPRLFENFSLTVKAGEKIGLVGPSGGGKTTITRLLMRFMDIQDGSITIDEQDIRDIKQNDLRRNIAYVPQEPLLFHRSIKDNIRYGRPSATDAQVVAVAKKAFAHDFIAELPEGYDTLVGERGVKLSGGQRQRVAIARAMLADTPLLILDEATSALDSESEKLIQGALGKLMQDKTAVVIAHRLSTIQRMDRIVVLDKGKIVEEGTHQDLLKRKGLYARLWAHQSGGFIEA